MYGKKPSNWYEMDYSEQKEWKRQQQAIESAEYDARQAKDQADADISRMRRQMQSERESRREEYEAVYEEYREVSYDFDRLLKVVEACLGTKGVDDSIEQLNRIFRPDYVEVQARADYED